MNVKNAFSPPLPGFETLFDALSILVLDECDELLRQDGADTRRKGGVTVWGSTMTSQSTNRSQFQRS